MFICMFFNWTPNHYAIEASSHHSRGPTIIMIP